MPRETVVAGSRALRRESVALCRLAYDEDLTDLLESVGPSVHVVVRDGEALVCQLIAEVPQEFQLAALSPATIPFYGSGRRWLGPLRIRMPDGNVVATPPDEIVMIHELSGRPRVDTRRPLSVEWRSGEVW